MTKVASVPEILRLDFELLNNGNQLENEGITLTDASSSSGRVVFSLQEIPLRVTFFTPHKNRLQRVSDNRIFVASPDGSSKCKIELERIINHTNKDHFLWAQEQSDLCILNDPKLLALNGFTIREQISGAVSRINDLKEIPLGNKFFTENDNILERVSEYQVAIGDKIVTFGEAKENGSSLKQTNSGDDLNSAIASILFDDTPGELQDDDTKQLVATLGCLLMESPDFPKIKSLQISGEGNHGLPLTAEVAYSGGVEGNSIIRWERCTEQDPSFMPIKGATALQYTPTVVDVGALIRLAYMPVRADGVTGMIVFSKIIKIKIDPEIKAEVDSNLSMNTLMFKVLLRNGNEFQKRSILLNRVKVKVRKRRSTITKMKYGPDLRVIPDLENHCLFTLVFSEKDTHVFMTPSQFQRDIIVLTIKGFNGEAM